MSYAQSAKATFTHMLGTLDHLIDTAQSAGLTDDVLQMRLTDDMFPLELQFRVALNQVLLALDQVGDRTVALEEAPYGSLAEVRDRIAAVRNELDRSDPDAWAAAGAPVDLTLPNGVRFLMTAEEDIRDWILPNFYFHATLAYALLRAAGLPIGKMDFIPHMAGYRVSTTG